MALLGPREMSDLSPQSETKRTLIRSLSPIHDFMSTRPRCDLFEQLQPLRAEAEFKVGKTGDVAAWPRQAVDDAGGDRVADVREHDGHGAGGLLQCLNAWGGRGQNDVRRERQKLLRSDVRCTTAFPP